MDPRPQRPPGRIWPAPVANGSALDTRSESRTEGLAVVISADLASAAVQPGWACLSSAYTPAMCGLATDVPAIAWNSSPGGMSASGYGDWPARIERPGATTSGLTTSGAAGFGPRPENAATVGAWRQCP